MADIADIVIRVDSSQVTAASGNLNNLQKNTVGLLSSLSRAGAASLQYKREVALLNEANRQNILTHNELARSLVQLQSRYNSMGLAVDSAGNLMESSQAKANNFGHKVQQVGYQVGDFFVQVQSGTNVMVAFGQQATQLAGLIPGVLGAGLGIGISLFTAIGATLMRSSESAGTFQDALDKVKDSLSDTDDVLGLVNGDLEELKKNFGDLSSATQSLVDTKVDIALRGMADAAKSLRSELTEMYNGNAWGNTSRAQELGEVFRFGTQNTRELAAAMEELKNQDTLQGQVEAAARLRELFLAMAGPVEKMTSDERDFYIAMVDAEEASRRLLEATENVQEATQGTAEAQKINVEHAERYYQILLEQDALNKERDAAVQSLIDSRDDELRKLAQQKDMLQTILTFGKDSVEVKEKEAHFAREAYRAELDRLGIVGNFIAPLMKAYDAMAATKAEVENASIAAENLETALQAAASAMAQLSGFSAGIDVKIAQAAAKVEALKTGANAANASLVAGLRAEAEQRRQTAASVAVGADQLREINRVYEDSIEGIKILEGLNNQAAALEESTKKGAGGTKKLKEELTAAQKAAQDFANAMDGYVVGAVDGVANAFGDFVMRGFKDFKGFVKNIIGSFKNMLAQMIALAARNQILIGLGFAAPVAGAVGGAAMGAGFGAGAAGAGAATGIGAAFGAAASGLSSGFMTSVYGGLGGTVGAVSGGLSVGGIAGISTAIGAIAAPLLAVAAVFAFFKKKTKELDSGLRVTVNNMDALVETFKTVQTTQFFGLSKKTTTTVGEAGAEISDPIVKAVQDIQTQVLKAAEMFGIAESEFEDFVYNFEVSLKGLTDEQKLQKVNEELLKMGDAFASLSGHFTSMNELLAAAQQRYDLQTRLLELQGDTEALLARQRELELAAVHDLNLALLQQIHTLEDYNQAVANTASAAANLRSAMDRELSAAQSGLDVARAQLEKAVQRRVATIQSGFAKVFASIEAQIDSAKAKAESSRRIFELLDNALSGRSAVSEAGAFASRRAAMTYVSSGGMDVDKLTSALGVLNEPSEQFFGTFQDYARDFALTTNAIEQSRAVAEASMTADEKAVQLLEQSLEQARSSEARQIAAAEKLLAINEEVLTVEEAMAQYMEAQATYEQIQAQHEELIAQFPMLSETFLSVADAILALNSAIAAQTAAQTAVANAIASAANVSTGDVPGFASGGMFSGGPRIVGENGPELEVTGPSRIYSNRDTANMFRDPELASAVDGLRREVSGMRSEQLQIQVEVSKNVKRIYDIERKWDTDGLPPERV